jgi:K+-transporting ATPase ATPase A chain
VGTNGGGYFNANSSHPFENPTPLSNFLQEVAILLLPAALCFTFGRIVGDGRQGWALYAAMVLLLAVAVAGAVVAESRGTAAFPPGIDGSAGNLEGKEVRFGSAS